MSRERTGRPAGRPRKHADRLEVQRAYDQRQRERLVELERKAALLDELVAEVQAGAGVGLAWVWWLQGGSDDEIVSHIVSELRPGRVQAEAKLNRG